MYIDSGIKFSIIVPCYNIENRVNSLFSMLSCDYERYEVIYIDDCSTDETYTTLKNKAKLYRNYIVRQTRENGGPGVARNVGLDEARGEYILFCDSDDYFDITVLKKIDMVIGRFDDFDLIISPFNIKRRSKVKRCDRYSIVRDCCAISPIDVVVADPNPVSKIFLRRIIEQNNLRFPTIRLGEDKCFVVNYLIYAERVYKLDFIYYMYVMNSYSLTHLHKNDVNGKTIFEQLQPIYEKYFGSILPQLFANDHLLAKAKDMVYAKCSNKEIREYFLRENKRYSTWLDGIDLSKQSIYRKLIYKAMYHANPYMIRLIMNIRKRLY